MRTRNGVIRRVSIFLSLGLLSVALVPRAHADAWNQRTLVTVNQPVEIPGRVLGPGTYTFQLVVPGWSRDVVEIKNHETGQFIALVSGIPTYRATMPYKPIVTLAERPSDTPPAISEWFYPDQHYGLKFIYSRSDRRSIAAVMHKSHSAKS